MEIQKEFKTVDGKYPKEKMTNYMREYIANNNVDVNCDICGGHYKKVTGKHYHLSTKKHKFALKSKDENTELKKEVENYVKFKQMMKDLKI
jgi:hypothetical protein